MNRPCPHIHHFRISMQPLGVLCWLFRGTVSTISVCSSIFLHTALQSAPMPFDRPSRPPEAARYWSDNGPEWISWPLLRAMPLALKTYPAEMSQFTSVSISTSVFKLCSFCVDKSGCLCSFCSLSNEPFPPETSAPSTKTEGSTSCWCSCPADFFV